MNIGNAGEFGIMIHEFYRFRDVDLSALMAVYQQSIYTHSEEGRCAESAFYEDLRLFFLSKGAVLSVMDIDGVYVSAVRLESYRDGYLITCLETAPAYRNKGYAHLLLDSLMKKYPGVYYAHVEKRNKISVALHKKLGFSVYLDHAVYVDGSVYANCYTFRK